MSIQELSEELQRLMEEYNQLIDAQGYFPTVKMIRFIQKMITLLAILRQMPTVAWRALFRLVRCDNGGLVDLTVEQLKQLVEMLKALADLELEAAEEAPAQEALRAWIRELEQTLSRWDDGAERDQAVAAVAALKAFLRDHYPVLLSTLLHYFGDDIREAVADWAKKSIPGRLKKILQKLIAKILVRRLGEEGAKKCNPWVGVGLTLAELLGFGYVLITIDDLRELIDETLAELVRRLHQAGMRWPGSGHVGFPSKFAGAQVRVRAFMRCARIVDGKPVWGAPCRVRFAQGAQITTTLDPDSKLYDAETGLWKLPFNIDQDSVKESECFEGAVLCYLYFEVFITFPDGSTMTYNLLGGVAVL